MVTFYHLGRLDLGKFVDGVYFISFERVFTNLCVVSVPLFFMVNGALLLNKIYKTKKIYYKAFKIALIILVWYITDFPSWFLRTLLILYILYPLFIKIFKAKNKIYLYLLLIAVFVMPFVYNLLTTVLLVVKPNFSIIILGKEISLNMLPPKTGAFTLYSILYFMLGGVFLNKKLNPIVSIILFISGIAFVTIEGVICSNGRGVFQDTVNGYFPTIGALMASVGAFNMCRLIENIENNKARRAITFLGSKALPIYIFHVPLIKLTHIILPPDDYSIVLILLISALIVSICCLIGFVLEKIPYIRELIKI